MGLLRVLSENEDIIIFREEPAMKSYEKALDWFKKNRVGNTGVVIHTKKKVPYPEVTGYFIPTLYHWDEGNLANSCMKWLLSIQLDDGSFPASDGKPYTFDTGQVLRGLCAAWGRVDGVEAVTEKAGDWLLTQIRDDGRVVTPTQELWGDIASELIHIYVLPPLIESGKLLGKPEYLQAANHALSYYKKQPGLVSFNRLSHFHAYCMEALYELGEVDLVREGMADVARHQNRDGGIPAYPDVKWICSTGIAQYAVVWYQTGEKKKANQAIAYLEKIQNESGGFFGSYGNEARYIPSAEISWAVKYFLDAYSLKLACS